MSQQQLRSPSAPNARNGSQQHQPKNQSNRKTNFSCNAHLIPQTPHTDTRSVCPKSLNRQLQAVFVPSAKFKGHLAVIPLSKHGQTCVNRICRRCLPSFTSWHPHNNLFHRRLLQTTQKRWRNGAYLNRTDGIGGRIGLRWLLRLRKKRNIFANNLDW